MASAMPIGLELTDRDMTREELIAERERDYYTRLNNFDLKRLAWYWGFAALGMHYQGWARAATDARGFE